MFIHIWLRRIKLQNKPIGKPMLSSRARFVLMSADNPTPPPPPPGALENVQARAVQHPGRFPGPACSDFFIMHLPPFVNPLLTISIAIIVIIIIIIADHQS